MRYESANTTVVVDNDVDDDNLNSQAELFGSNVHITKSKRQLACATFPKLICTRARVHQKHMHTHSTHERTYGEMKCARDRNEHLVPPPKTKAVRARTGLANVQKALIISGTTCTYIILPAEFCAAERTCIRPPPPPPSSPSLSVGARCAWCTFRKRVGGTHLLPVDGCAAHET